MEKLSLVVNVLDKEKASWIWACHQDESKQQEIGIAVRVISNGDLNKRCELLKEKIEILEDAAILYSATAEKLDKIDMALEKTWERVVKDKERSL